MASVRRAGAWLAGVILALGGLELASGKSQLVMEEIFSVDAGLCDGVSCRTQFVGANETFGLASHDNCTAKMTYGLSNLQASSEHNFDLLYECRGSVNNETLSEVECGVDVCADVSTNPNTSEITYQISFSFAGDPRPAVNVSVELRFDYMEVNNTDIYDARSRSPISCPLKESCHRSCNAGEHLVMTTMEDHIGDGWNAGGINFFDHFRVDKREDVAALAGTRSSSYQNTMPGGFLRTIPLCMEDGQYLFSTHLGTLEPDRVIADPSWLVDGIRNTSESSWSMCGQNGSLSSVGCFQVMNDSCNVIDCWDYTPAPYQSPTSPSPISTSPTVPSPTVPSPTVPSPTAPSPTSPSPTVSGSTEAPVADTGTSTRSGNKMNVPLIAGLCALGFAGLAAAGGTYAQKKGWFNPAGAGGDAEADEAGAAAPNPDVDEFAP